MLIIEEALRQVVSSLLVSVFYSTAAVGLTLSFTITKIANFAHAEYITIGAYVGAILTLIGLDPLLALITAALVASIVALLTDEVFYKPLYKRGARPLQLFVASIGVGLFLRYLMSLYADIGDMLFLSSRFSQQPLFYLGYGAVTNLHILSIILFILFIGFLYSLVSRTKIGKGMRAIASNPELALVSGIPVWKIRRIAWLIAGFAAGLAGVLWSYYTSINPETGWRMLLWVFSASIIGGFTSIWQTVLGGFIIGYSENMVMWFLNSLFNIDPAYKPLIPYGVIVITLLVRKPPALLR
ncbi:MAG: branched-chain amino acid ABC transporter permease [Thaumarchaeota archaeon]|jgi:branched-chain amino acid transport system permease protein/neutral amino acid transport system permease protein|nr:branched-chain amino acid ABC transporter permease [Candidatus Geocrenenecus arthurdayi]MCL7389728.1 branched-chain amino acid ABC transporter permease [Candidatus Geocrenenecus arthurdayi]MCL7391074.1 branched-chain amino acid ABC transporter permease [Candidatus Geocrenenecus arthurdayi]MCL7396910.1 branched-chain amino acid ABC transporter permease [Candidatus Geocrenenecus arthurdayi]MCL7403450.1 branched-chain amino acid ABC transporter permease [Candidatus Geocrenenecus arthurdayi]